MNHKAITLWHDPCTNTNTTVILLLVTVVVIHAMAIEYNASNNYALKKVI